MLTCEQIESAVLALGPVTRENHQEMADKVIPPVHTNGWLKKIPRRVWDTSIPEVAEAKRAITWESGNTYVDVAVLRAALNQRDGKLVEIAKEKEKSNG
jgi:hypothetical protein